MSYNIIEENNNKYTIKCVGSSIETVISVYAPNSETAINRAKKIMHNRR